MATKSLVISKGEGRSPLIHSVPAVRRDPQQTKGESRQIALLKHFALGLNREFFNPRILSPIKEDHLTRISTSISTFNNMCKACS